MQVFKFGGASVKDAEAVKNISTIIRLYKEPLVIVVFCYGENYECAGRGSYAFFLTGWDGSRKFQQGPQLPPADHGPTLPKGHEVYKDVDNVFKLLNLIEG
jgi:hypothetical protein